MYVLSLRLLKLDYKRFMRAYDLCSEGKNRKFWEICIITNSYEQTRCFHLKKKNIQAYVLSITHTRTIYQLNFKCIHFYNLKQNMTYVYIIFLWVVYFFICFVGCLVALKLYWVAINDDIVFSFGNFVYCPISHPLLYVWTWTLVVMVWQTIQ